MAGGDPRGTNPLVEAVGEALADAAFEVVTALEDRGFAVEIEGPADDKAGVVLYVPQRAPADDWRITVRMARAR